MMLELPNHLRANEDVLQRIAQQVADKAYVACMRQLYKHGNIGTMIFQRLMGRMPDALPTVYPSRRLDIFPCRIEFMALMAQPFRTELPGPAMDAPLYSQPAVTQSRPEWLGEAVALRRRDWQAGRQIKGICCLLAHSTVSEPNNKSLAGVTIGPPMTNATSLRAA